MAFILLNIKCHESAWEVNRPGDHLAIRKVLKNSILGVIQPEYTIAEYFKKVNNGLCKLKYSSFMEYKYYPSNFSASPSKSFLITFYFKLVSLLPSPTMTSFIL